MADPDPVVLPLFRAPVRKQNAAYRDNMARLEVAALVADPLSAPPADQKLAERQALAARKTQDDA